jgi:hypothetical protein
VTYSIEYSKVAVEKEFFFNMPGEFISLAHGNLFQFTTIKKTGVSSRHVRLWGVKMLTANQWPVWWKQ